ncbi:MAG: hypothetical protein ABF324_04945 [Lentimonas sp.]
MMFNQIRQFMAVVLLPTLSLRRLLCGVVGALLSLVAYVCIPVETAELVVRNLGYWFTFFAVVGFTYYCIQQRAIVFTWCYRFGRGARCCLLGAWLVGGVLLFAHAHFGPKVMMDDAILESTARSLHEDRQVYVSTYGRTVENKFLSFDGYVDKRPWLYPFAVSVLHDLTGYRIANAYATNAIAGLLFLGMLLVLGQQIAGLRGGVLLMLLWLSIPLFAQNATGSGMDMVNLLMLTVVFVASVLYLKRPSYESEGLLSLAGVLLAYSRYESALFCVLVLVIIVIGWIRSRRIWLSVGSVLAAPLLIGLAMQHKFFSASQALWELHSGTTSPFGIEYFGVNLSRALSFFFNTSDEMGNSFLVATLGFISVFLLLIRLLKHSDQMAQAQPMQWAVGLMSVFLFGHLAIILCYHDGALDRLFAARFALPFYLLLTCHAVLCLQMFSRSRTAWNIVFAAIVVFLCVSTFPKNAKAVFTHRNYVVREQQWIESFLQSEAKTRALVVDYYGVYWSLRDVSALSQDIVLLSEARIAEEVVTGKFSELIVVDRFELEIKQGEVVVMPSNFNPESFDLQLVAEASFKPFELTRIYRVSNLQPSFHGDK